MPISLDRNEVHIWQAELSDDPSSLVLFYAFLQPEERDKADRFHFERDRNKYIAARAILRELLGWYLEKNPATVCLRNNEQGKPMLVPPDNVNLHFNLSHSGKLALFAFCIGYPVGIDLEFMQPGRDFEEIVGNFFSTGEISYFRTLAPQDKPAAFYSMWTLKEAYVKALGTGLWLGLDRFEVATSTPHLVRTDYDPENIRQWSLQKISVDPDYKAAIAVKLAQPKLVTFAYPAV